MATSTTYSHLPAVNWPFLTIAKQIWLAGLVVGLIACSQTSQPSSGSRKTVRLSVGEIKDITLSKRGDGSSELIGTSDNQEVVEISRQKLAPAVDTLKRENAGPTIFQLKGVTVGTANVVFSRKPMAERVLVRPYKLT